MDFQPFNFLYLTPYIFVLFTENIQFPIFLSSSQKRRSGRNVKRKRYTESIDIQFSGDDDNEFQLLPGNKTQQQIAELKVN